MRNFISLNDVDDIGSLVQSVVEIKSQGFSNSLQKKLTLGLLFFNSSLRTRLSSQKAARLLGIENFVLDLAHGWPLEFRDGVVMDQDKSEHVREAAPVVSQYCDILGIRSFPGLKNRALDYAEPVLTAFRDHGSVPLINLESATRHPLQALADMATIFEHSGGKARKVVLTWAPHPKALPQSVANSFAVWAQAMGHDLTITHPRGYELDPAVTQGATVEYDPEKAYVDADFIYAKNWSSYQAYGQILSQDDRWKVDEEKMAKSKKGYFMHCLPVRRNVVVSDVVIDSDRSLVVEQANNRTWAMAAVLNHIVSTHC